MHLKNFLLWLSFGICLLTLQQTVNAKRKAKESDPKCLRHRLAKRMIGGADAEITEFPYQASLEYLTASGAYCGGAIISKSHIITAAHCLYIVYKKDGKENIIELNSYFYQVRVGSGLRGQGGFVLKESSHFIHPQYSRIPLKEGGEVLTNDLAIIKTETAIPIDGKNVKKIQMYEEGEKIPRGTAWVAGLGYTELLDYYDYINGCYKKKDPAPLPPKKLQYLQMKIIDDEECKDLKKGLQPKIICAIGGKDQSPYNGDSGSPLVIRDSSNPKFAGIMSSSNGEYQVPAQFVDISKYRTWIDQKLKA